MAYLGNSPIHRLYSTPKITLTQGQTVVPVKYTPGLALFFKNGVLLHPGDDYTATNGSTLTLATPAFEGDILQGVNLAWFAVANALTTFGGELEGELTGPSSASETKAGLVKLATTAQAQALTDDTTIITPKKLGDAMNAHVLGMGQTWQDMTASRSANTTYTNTTGRTICVALQSIIGSDNKPGTSIAIVLRVDGVLVQRLDRTASNVSEDGSLFAVVPPGSTYEVISSAALVIGTHLFWSELR